MPTITEEAAEAVCGALHRFDWKFTGETLVPLYDNKMGLCSYWVRGQAPHAVAVEVLRDDPFVKVVVKWHNLSAPPRIVRTRIELRVDCSPDRNRERIEESTTGVVHKCLEILRDVGEGSGYAGPDYLTKPHANWRPTI